MKKLLTLLLLLSTTAFAQVQLVVPFPPGGPSDTAARNIAAGFNDYGVEMIVVNKPGATGVLGTNYVAQSKPDGNTLLWGGASTNIFALINNSSGVQYTLSSFDEVAMIVKLPTVLLENKDANHNPLKVGYTNDVAKYAVLKLYGEDRAVPYNGSAPALRDLMGGHIPFVIDTACPTANTVQGSAASVVKLLPEYSTFYGIYAPAGTPTKILDKYNNVANQILNNPKYRQPYESCYGTVVGGTRQAFKRAVQLEYKQYSQ
jgi:tripartite-type tricarboxylate transporter receptor subunit TctC